MVMDTVADTVEFLRLLWCENVAMDIVWRKECLMVVVCGKTCVIT